MSRLSKEEAMMCMVSRHTKTLFHFLGRTGTYLNQE